MSGPADIESLSQGCSQILSTEELAKRLALKRPLRIKLGVDPTAPDIHFGHTVGLAKLRQFQDAGHQAILILGDFTAMVGDPSGRSATRPQLTRDEVLANAKTYQEQAFKVLDPDKTEVVFNGEWFGKMGFSDIIRLNSRVTLQQMLQREDFKARIGKGHPIGAHEIQYPIMQGWDSVMIQADVELGGTDQLFNILVGRDLQIEEKQLPQIAMMLPILEGTDGVQKMSKSLGNSIGVTENSKSMFGKIMSIPDEIMGTYYKLLLMEPLPADAHPMEAKKALASKLVTRFHSQAEAKAALEDFEQRFSQRDLESADLPVFPIGEARNIVDLVVEAYAKNHGTTRSKSEVRRLVTQGSIQWNGEKITDPNHLLGSESGVLKLDKRRAVRIA
ncbi:MAG: tyrosine--tRNA ligase [Chthoniobacterales bacterium]